MAINGCECKEKQGMYTGQVVSTFVKQTSYDDYFYVTIWDGVQSTEHQYESSAYGHCAVCGGRGSASVDASPETMASYYRHVGMIATQSHNTGLHSGRIMPDVASIYTVVRGRKVAKGTTGYCSHVRVTQYGYMAALQTVTGLVYVDSKNLAVA